MFFPFVYVSEVISHLLLPSYFFILTMNIYTVLTLEKLTYRLIAVPRLKIWVANIGIRCYRHVASTKVHFLALCIYMRSAYGVAYSAGY